MPGDLSERETATPWAGIRIVWRLSPAWTIALALTSVVEGVLPAISAVAGGRLLGAVPAAVAHGGLAGPAGHRAIAAAAILVGAFALGQTSDALMFACAQGFSVRTLYNVHRRVMEVSLAPHILDPLMGPAHRELIDKAKHDRWPNMFAFVSGLRRLITFRVLAASSAVLVARFDWRLAVALVLVYGVVGYRLRKTQRDAVWYGDEPVRRAHYFRETALTAEVAKELRVFGLVPWMLSNFDAEWRRGMSKVWQARRKSRVEAAILFLVVLAANVVSFTLVANAARDGHIGVPTLMVVISATFALCQLGLVLPEDDHVAQGAAVAKAVWNARPRNEPGPTGTLPERAHELRIEQLSFDYPGQTKPIFDGLNLTVPAGRSLAIVGANGAGKTTLVKLLGGLHRPVAGTIKADGVDIATLDPAWWQRRIAAIFQDFVHYPMSAADNVGFGAVERRDDRDLLNRAAERAGMADLIGALPDGWDTVLSRSFEGGVDLSGGQWQRVALARALAAVEGGAGVLVLDEPTANLDVRGEVELFDRFLEVTRGYTTILISHRFSTVRRADRIVVLSNGRVLEEGSHAELVARGGRYARLFALQAARYRDEPLEEAG